MLRASMAALQMATPTVRRRGVAGVHAVVHLEDVTLPDGATEAYVPVTLSHPVSGTDLVLTLSGGVLCTIPVGQTSGKSAHYTVTPGDPPFEVTIASYEGGSFASLDVSGTCTVTPGQPLEAERVYKGSIVQATSGSISKTDLLSIAGDVAISSVEVDCEAVGGGGGGWSGSGNVGKGGAPGKVAVATVPYALLPDVIDFMVAAGGTHSNAGGSTDIVGIVTAAVSGSNTTFVSPKDRPTGPGAGAAVYLGDGEAKRGGASNDSIPELRLAGGTGAVARPSSNGKDATTPFQHGSAGGSHAQHGGYGGWPGGGGGHGGGSGYYGGKGGAGAARFHVYVWE